CRKIEMIVAPNRRRDAEKDPVDEQEHRDFLHPQPRMSDQARDNVCKHDHAEAGDGYAAQQHQRLLKPIERAPLEVTLMLQHEAVELRHFGCSRRPPRLGDGPDHLEYLDRMWAEVLREFVLDGTADLLEAALVDVVHHL